MHGVMEGSVVTVDLKQLVLRHIPNNNNNTKYSVLVLVAGTSQSTPNTHTQPQNTHHSLTFNAQFSFGIDTGTELITILLKQDNSNTNSKEDKELVRQLVIPV